MTAVPKVTFGVDGFIAPSDAAILAGRQTDINTAFGGTLNPALNTPQGQLATSDTAIISQADADFLYYTTQTDPAFAQGRMQDAIGNIYFITRIGSQPTVLQVLCTGLTGTVIPAGALVQDTSSYTYACTQGGTIGVAGNVTLPFANLTYGVIPVPGTNAISIYQTVLGWDTATVSSGVLGNETETRAQFEERRSLSTAANSFGASGSSVGTVAQVPGVTDFWGYDNSQDTSTTIMGVTIPAHAIYIAVVGGTDLAVAEAILSKKAPGCGYGGNTSVTAYDSNPLYSAPIPYTITFERPPALQILYVVNITNNALVPANAISLIQAAIINAFAGNDGGTRARIGTVLYASRYYAPVALLGSWARIVDVYIGSNNNSDAARFTGAIVGTALTVSSVTGTIVIGQTISDATGNIIVGTRIVSGSGTSWVVDTTQNVLSEAMVSASANQNTVTVNANQEPEINAANIVVNLI